MGRPLVVPANGERNHSKIPANTEGSTGDAFMFGDFALGVVKAG